MHRRLARTPALLVAALTLTLVAAAGTTDAEDVAVVPATTSGHAPAPSAAGSAQAGDAVTLASAKAKHKKRKARKRKQRAAKKPRVVAPAPAQTGNPLAGRTWGIYKGRAEMAWAPYAKSTGAERELLAKIALRPKAKWFGDWIALGDVTKKVDEYIANSQAGDPTALVQMTVFRMKPWEHEACKRLPSAAEQAAYKQWTDRFAAAIGSTPTAIVLQPDGPFALCAPGGSTLPSSLIAYSAKKFSALPNTSVYLEAGAADWPAPGSQGGVEAAVKILVRGGVQYTRGFALNGTHYSDTNLEVARGTAIVQALAGQGMPGKKFVVNTATNGRPFVFGDYTGPDPDNAFVCQSKSEPRSKTCVTLGIPPTTDVANPRWGLARETNTRALAHVDGYLWFGRPWLHRQNSPFVMSRALDLARSTPY